MAMLHRNWHEYLPGGICYGDALEILENGVAAEIEREGVGASCLRRRMKRVSYIILLLRMDNIIESHRQQCRLQ